MRAPTSRRRRIVLMRHGAVDYFGPDGSPLPSETVPLNDHGRAQADAAGALVASGQVRFDRVVVSGLPRTVETARRVLAASGQDHLAMEVEPALQEIRGGQLSEIPEHELAHAFTGAFLSLCDVESQRFLAGESVGEMLDRVLPAFEAIIRNKDWDCLLLVLHGGINRAILSRALTGTRAFFGRLEQSPACLNLIDVGSDDLVVRAMNLAPTEGLHANERQTSMERMLMQYARHRSVAAL